MEVGGTLTAGANHWVKLHTGRMGFSKMILNFFDRKH